jgi:hypothetical protein
MRDIYEFVKLNDFKSLEAVNEDLSFFKNKKLLDETLAAI